MATTAVEHFQGYATAAKSINTFNVHDQLILAAARVYMVQCQKATKAPIMQRYAVRAGTKSYKVFQKVVAICSANKWLLGEYIGAQFAMMGGNRFPLLCHLATPGAQSRYNRFVRMFKGQPLKAVIAPSEKAAMERAANASVRNLVVLLLARGKATMLEDDFSFCDRYTLAFFAKTDMLPAKQQLSDVAEELDLLNFSPARWSMLETACKEAAAKALTRLEAIDHEYARSVNKLKEEVALVISSLYGTT